MYNGYTGRITSNLEDNMNAQITLSQAWGGFLIEKQAEGRSAYTLRNYSVTWKKVELFLKEKHPGENPLFENLDRSFWVEFMAWLQNEYTFTNSGVAAKAGSKKRPLSAKSCCNVHTDLSAFYTWALKTGLAKSHIFHSINRPRYSRPVIIPYTKTECRALLKACEFNRPSKKQTRGNARPTALRDKSIILFLVSTGVRVSELCTLTFKDLDVQTNQALVRGKGPGREPKQRTIHFGQRTAKLLWRYIMSLENKKPDDPVFQSYLNPSEPLERNALRKLLLRIGDRAGVKGTIPHRFRHTFAINYIRNTGDLFSLQMLLGHTSLQMVQTYARLAQQDCETTHRRADPADNWNL